jgi:hypothetical protein
MACTITLLSSGEHPLLLQVEQSAEEVAVRMGEGEPFTLIESSTGLTVHVNPAAVAFWKNHPRPAAA